jgi:hypothetical protein
VQLAVDIPADVSRRLRRSFFGGRMRLLGRMDTEQDKVDNIADTGKTAVSAMNHDAAGNLST